MKINMKALIAEDPNWFVEQIKKVRAFSVLSYTELLFVLSQMWRFYFKAGTTILNQGEAANLFFIVHKGMVEVSMKKFFFREKQVAILESGDFFGESALVSNSKRNATVIAKTDTSCFVLLKPSFKFMLQENPLFRQNMKAVYARRKLQLKNA
jgi:CRP-like cAMP-binding protein